MADTSPWWAMSRPRADDQHHPTELHPRRPLRLLRKAGESRQRRPQITWCARGFPPPCPNSKPRNLPPQLTNLPRAVMAASFLIALAIALVAYQLALVFSVWCETLSASRAYGPFNPPLCPNPDAGSRPCARNHGSILASTGHRLQRFGVAFNRILRDQYWIYREPTFSSRLRDACSWSVLETPASLIAAAALGGRHSRLLYPVWTVLLPGEFGLPHAC